VQAVLQRLRRFKKDAQKVRHQASIRFTSNDREALQRAAISNNFLQ
jgi:hypothetical protein